MPSIQYGQAVLYGNRYNIPGNMPRINLSCGAIKEAPIMPVVSYVGIQDTKPDHERIRNRQYLCTCMWFRSST